MANLDDVIQVLSLIVSTISIVGNSLVCHIIIRTRSMRTGMNYLLLNLALLDIVTGFLGIFNILIDGRSEMLGTTYLLEQVHNRSAVTAEVLCKVKMSFWLGIAVTPLLLTAIAYERYMAVVHPLSRRAGSLTKARLRCILAFSWSSGIGFLVFELIVETFEGVQGVCAFAPPEWYNNKIYTIFLASIQFIIPSIIMFVLYFRLIKALRTREALGVQEVGQRARNKARRKVVFIIITMTIIFYICCGIPQALYFLFVLFKVKLWVYSGKISVLLFCVNSLSNPLIYFSFMKTFRERLLKLICKAGGNENPQGSIVIVNRFSLNRQNNASNYESSGHLDKTFENEPKLLRMSRSASSVF